MRPIVVLSCAVVLFLSVAALAAPTEQLWTVTFAGEGTFDRHGQFSSGPFGCVDDTFSDSSTFSWKETWKDVSLTRAGVARGTGSLEGTSTETHVFNTPSRSGCQQVTCKKTFFFANPREEKGFAPLELSVIPRPGETGAWAINVDVPNQAGPKSMEEECPEGLGENPIMVVGRKLGDPDIVSAFATQVHVRTSQLAQAGKIVVNVKKGPLNNPGLIPASCSIDPKNFPCVLNQDWHGTITLVRQ